MKIIKQVFQVILPMFFFVSMASSGVVINMEISSAKGDNYQKTKAQYYIVPLASRMDMDISMPPKFKPEEDEKQEPTHQRATMILRLDKEVFWMIMPDSESYCEFTFEEFKKMQEKGKSPLADGSPQNISESFGYKRAKGGKKIIGYSAQKYIIWGDNFKGMSWATSKRFRTLEKFAINQAKAFNDYEILGAGAKNNIPGLVLEQKMKTNDDVRSSMKVKSIKIKRFSEGTFNIPEDYTEIDLAAWMDFKDSFTPGKIWSKVKEEVKEQAKEEVKSQGKNAAKGAVKSLFGF
jgi:Domain of unknown function (DUF4412)